MKTAILESSEELQAHESSLKTTHFGPLWQSLGWKAYQEALGRKTRLYGQFGDDGNLLASALVVIDETTFGLSTWDMPRGPVWSDESAATKLLEKIVSDAKKEKCMALTFSPTTELSLPSSKNSARHEQPEATLMIDLTKGDEEILSAMKQKGRYNINVAKKSGVTVEESNDVDALYALLQKTGARDQFGIQQKSHYEKFLSKLPGSFLLLAYAHEDTKKTPIAALLGVLYGDTSIYYYGASDYAYRASMAPYLLQWEAMQYCKKQGAQSYDLLGIAPTDDPAHAWAGVTRFKKQFGGEIITYPPEQEIPLKPVAKRLIEWKRRLLG